MSRIGDKSVSVNTTATVQHLPLRAEALVGDAADPLNDAVHSGKKAGVMIAVELASGDIYPAIAQGGSNTDAWIVLDGATTITPA